MFLERAEIVSNQVVAPGYYKMVLASERIAKKVKPGQFVHIRCSESYQPLLRRPFSIHSQIDGQTFSLLYQVVGTGTALLSQKKPRQSLDVLGPLGQGFETYPQDERAILVGGGIGVAPLLFLAQQLLKGKKQVILLLGAKTKDRLLAVSDFKSLDVEVTVTTEDGSAGSRGIVSDLFEQTLLTTDRPRKTTIYACGPEAMLARITTISLIYDFPCQVCLEEMMACGVGACLSCVVATKQGYRRVCAEGPVFDGGEIEWEKIVG